jgi:hypothetical protein
MFSPALPAPPPLLRSEKIGSPEGGSALDNYQAPRLYIIDAIKADLYISVPVDGWTEACGFEKGIDQNVN